MMTQQTILVHVRHGDGLLRHHATSVNSITCNQLCPPPVNGLRLSVLQYTKLPCALTTQHHISAGAAYEKHTHHSRGQVENSTLEDGCGTLSYPSYQSI